MRRFIFLLILLILSVWTGLKIAEDPGYALFSYQQWSVAMPLWFFIVTFFAVLLCFYVATRFWDSIGFSLYRLKNWMRWRRKNKSYNKTSHGLIELIEAHWRGAEYYLLEGMKRSSMPLVNYLAAAKAAHEQNAFERRDNYLRRAHDVAPQAEIAIGLTQAQFLLSQHQLEQALAILRQLYAKAPRHAQVLTLLERVYVHLADWDALLNILPNLRKANVIDRENLAKFEAHLYQQQLLLLASKADAISMAKNSWNKMPRKCQKDPALIATFVSILSKDPNTLIEAASLIQRSLKHSYHSSLVMFYGNLLLPDAKKQLAYAEDWSRKYGPHAELFLVLGKLSIRCQLWGKARQYLEKSLALEPTQEAYVVQGKLYEQLGETSLAMESYRCGALLGNAPRAPSRSKSSLDFFQPQVLCL